MDQDQTINAEMSGRTMTLNDAFHKGPFMAWDDLYLYPSWNFSSKFGIGIS